MDFVFIPTLHRFILVFFDDIFIYSSNCEIHLKHLHTVFSMFHSHSLFFKKYKCEFGSIEIGYPAKGLRSTYPRSLSFKIGHCQNLSRRCTAFSNLRDIIDASFYTTHRWSLCSQISYTRIHLFNH